jgi:hypothetical protein
VALSCPAAAQYPPQVDTVPSGSHPAVPPEQKVTCVSGPNSLAPNPTCPLLAFNGYTYWAYSFIDNRVAMAIVAYDSQGNLVKQWEKSGSRYVWSIHVDEIKQTVDFLGQSDAKITMSFAELDLQPPPPGTLKFVNVAAPAINCVFEASCTVTPTDSVGNIPMPVGVTGTGRLQSRTFVGAAGTPGAGKTAYLYRVDMTQAVSSGDVPCVTDLTVDFGAVSQLQYDGSGPADDGFVVTQGGLGSIGLFAVTKTGNSINFVFNQPVCAGPTPGTGHTSYFFGLASGSAPKGVTATVGWPGLEPLDVAARAPAY